MALTDSLGPGLLFTHIVEFYHIFTEILITYLNQGHMLFFNHMIIKRKNKRKTGYNGICHQKCSDRPTVKVQKKIW